MVAVISIDTFDYLTQLKGKRRRHVKWPQFPPLLTVIEPYEYTAPPWTGIAEPQWARLREEGGWAEVTMLLPMDSAKIKLTIARMRSCDVGNQRFAARALERNTLSSMVHEIRKRQ